MKRMFYVTAAVLSWVALVAWPAWAEDTVRYKVRLECKGMAFIAIISEYNSNKFDVVACLADSDAHDHEIRRRYLTYSGKLYVHTMEDPGNCNWNDKTVHPGRRMYRKCTEGPRFAKFNMKPAR